MSMRENVRNRMRQIGAVFSATRKADPRLLPMIVAIPLVVLVVIVGLGWLIGRPIMGSVIGVLFALLAASVVFGRRASAAQFTAMEGHPGAAAAVLQSMRGTWVVTPAIAFTRKQDLVHMVVGQPGVVLVGEGGKARTTQLLKQEQRKVSRAVGDTPVHILLVGDGEGQVPLNKLRTRMLKLPRGLKRKQIPAVNKRLEALGRGDLPIPKGPLPGGVKMPRQRKN
jgi:hypothetical protein